jgi:Ca2+-transporting ATPase
LIGWQGLMLASIALGAYFWALDEYGEGAHARTIALLSVVGVQLGHFFNCRSRSRSAFVRFFSNPYILAAAAIIITLQLLAVYFPSLMRILDTVTPNNLDYTIVAFTIILPVVFVEVVKAFTNRKLQKTEVDLGAAFNS